MTVEELKKKQVKKVAESDALRTKIQENTEAARKINAENQVLLQQRKGVLTELATLAAQIAELVAEENRKKLEEANKQALAEAAASEEKRKLEAKA